MLASSIVALRTAAAQAGSDEPPYFRAENSDVESAVEGVKKEEKVAISSTTSTDPGTTRGGGSKLPAGQVCCPCSSCHLCRLEHSSFQSMHESSLGGFRDKETVYLELEHSSGSCRGVFSSNFMSACAMSLSTMGCQSLR